METTTTVSAIGTLFTVTDFKRKGGNTIRIKVSFEQIATISNKGTYYKVILYVKKHKARNFIQQPNYNILEYISVQELYEAYFNHWNNLNPIKQFNIEQSNGKYTKFSVIGKNPDFNNLHALQGV